VGLIAQGAKGAEYYIEWDDNIYPKTLNNESNKIV
jgi:hypothetical protein